MTEFRSPEFQGLMDALAKYHNGGPMLEAACVDRAKHFKDCLEHFGFEVRKTEAPAESQTSSATEADVMAAHFASSGCFTDAFLRGEVGGMDPELAVSLKKIIKERGWGQVHGVWFDPNHVHFHKLLKHVVLDDGEARKIADYLLSKPAITRLECYLQHRDVQYFMSEAFKGDDWRLDTNGDMYVRVAA